MSVNTGSNKISWPDDKGMTSSRVPDSEMSPPSGQLRGQFNRTCIICQRSQNIAYKYLKLGHGNVYLA